MEEKTEYKNTPGFKKVCSRIFSVCLCAVSALVMLLAVFVLLIAFGKTSENTVELFGYKIYTCQSDIESAGIKSGSLIIIKNTDNDDFYTPQMLSQALVIPKAGEIIKQNGSVIAVCALVPFMLLFVIVLLRELRRAMIQKEQDCLNTEIQFVETEFFEQELEQTQKI